jgi:hypothetical protein
MRYPILIEPVFVWDTEHKFTVDPTISRFELGVDDRENLNLFPVSETISVRFTTRFYSTVDAFLRERRGKPFRLRDYNRMLDTPDTLYNMKKWAWEQLGPGLWACAGDIRRLNMLSSDISPEANSVSLGSLYPQSWASLGGDDSVWSL